MLIPIDLEHRWVLCDAFCSRIHPGLPRIGFYLDLLLEVILTEHHVRSAHGDTPQVGQDLPPTISGAVYEAAKHPRSANSRPWNSLQPKRLDCHPGSELLTEHQADSRVHRCQTSREAPAGSCPLVTVISFWNALVAEPTAKCGARLHRAVSRWQSN